jgi:hypothetical protein
VTPLKKIALPLVALALATALPAGAFAANVGVNTNAVTNTNVTGGKTSAAANTNSSTNTNVAVGKNSATTSTGATVNGTFSSKSSFSDVMGSLSSAKTSASIDFTAIHPKHVRFVLVSKLSGYTAAGLKISKANLANKTALDAKVAANASLTASLKKAGYLPSDVVAVSTDAKGDLTVFVAK